MNMCERAAKVIAPAAAHATALGVVRGEGSYLYDENGKKYLDFASGVAVCNVGHNHPAVVAAVHKQVDELIHGGHNVVYYETYVKLAEKLVEHTGGDTMVYFSNSGAEANEGAIKLAKYVTKRPAIIAFHGSFHGRTMGALSVTSSNASFRKYLEPMMPSVYFAEYPYCYRCPFQQKEGACEYECLQQFERIFERQIAPDTVAAMLIEPVAGEGGYVVPPARFLEGLHEICQKHGILLIFDEVQTGFGRTGKLFAYQHLSFRPDILTSAKGIGGGFPLSAVIARKDLMEKWPAGAHGGTFGGNPVACAASLAVLELLEGGLLDNATEQGVYLKERLLQLQKKFSCIGDVRGIGLMVGMEIVDASGAVDSGKAHAILDYCLENGLVLLGCGPKKQVIRFIAPTTVTKAEMDEALAVLAAALEQCS